MILIVRYKLRNIGQAGVNHQVKLDLVGILQPVKNPGQRLYYRPRVVDMLICLLLEEPKGYRLLPGRKRGLGVVKLVLPDCRKHIDILRVLVYLIAYIV